MGFKRIWSDEEVEYLKARQADTNFHPYTCFGRDVHTECVQTKGEYGKLLPTPQGWVCQCGRYRQFVHKESITGPYEGHSPIWIIGRSK